MTLAQKHHSFAPPHREIQRPVDYMKNGPSGYWLKLADDGWFDFNNPTYSQWSWRGITTALAKIPRFNGNTGTAYSVAQHSVFVHDQVPDDQPDHVKFYALIHDAPEAVLGDRVQPLKAYEFKTIQERFERLASIVGKHNRILDAKHLLLIDLGHPEAWLINAMTETSHTWPKDKFVSIPSIVKEIDERALLTEMRDLNFQPLWGLGLPNEPSAYDDLIIPHHRWQDAYTEFLDRLSLYVNLEIIR